nr:monocarboxylate transporter 3-like [Lytechinus pictus]XP_054764420.1 monocarboxylate transporter 3-like [Lytechinus pictus]
MTIMDSQRSRPHSMKRWLVLVGLFAVGYFDIGSIKSLGVILEEMANEFQTSIGVVGLAIGLSHSVAQFFAVMNIPLLKKFSAGKLVFAGSVIAGTGFSLMCFATAWVHFLLLMILVGFGYSVVILPAQISVIYYFPDHFEIASTIVLLGSGVGMMTLPLLTELLDEAYSWRGAILVIGALNLHSCVTALLMMTSDHQHAEPKVRSAKSHSSQVNEDPELTVSLINERDAIGPGSEDGVDADGNDYDGGGDGDGRGGGGGRRGGGDGVKDGWNEDGFFHSIIKIARKMFLDTFDLKLLYEYPRFTIFCLAEVASAVSYYGWIVFLIPNAEAKGILPDRAVLLATVGGTANISGRLTMGLLSARFNIRPQIIYSLVCILSAAAYFYNSFTKRFLVLGCLAAVNAFAGGVKVISATLLSKSSVPEERFPSAMILVSLIFGLGESFAGFIIGAAYNATESFDIMFCILGVASLIESCLVISPIIMDLIIAIITVKRT